MDDTTARLVDALLTTARDRGLELRRESAVLDETGWDFRVLHGVDTGGARWILRVPRRPDVAAAVDVEARLLALVRDRLPVAVPHWRIADRELVAYPRLAGEPAASEDVVTFRLHWRIDRQNPPQSYVEALGRCMAALHATPVEEAAATGIPVRRLDGVRARFGEQLVLGRAELGMHDTWWGRGRRWLDDDALWSPRSVLVHGDLHPGHTLVDDTGNLVGVLDWSDAEVGDPGTEFVEAARKFEPSMLDDLLAAYAAHGGQTWPGLARHVREGIAFAPLTLGVLGLTSDQERYVEAARARLGVLTHG
ncbi:macrolide phosphotransferase [Streptomyces sp. V3I8]|uniref:macrolide 2'-phosphotransferase n=1 Tax=Streptomyces sp. V3I8 TaxID=3042279 RepID=UPI002781F819|nr:macrolide 2'-phosphotransferase [Streptomyces sp. V3I8]MDQ1041582.1 macrolide phosphotransferase [Streptomyces sp. V3I8]